MGEEEGMVVASFAVVRRRVWCRHRWGGGLGGVVVDGDEEEGVATGEEEGVEAGTRWRVWRLHFGVAKAARRRRW